KECILATTHDVAAALAQALCRRIGEPRFHLWFADKTRFSWQSDQLVVGVPNPFLQDWLQKTFGDDVRAAAAETLGPSAVRFVIDPQLSPAPPAKGEGASVQASSESAPRPPIGAARPTPLAPHPCRQRRWRRLEDFVVGACNRVAHASALALIESP